jgi:hypothetical protein
MGLVLKTWVLESSLLGDTDPKGLNIPPYLGSKLKALGIKLNENNRYSKGLIPLSKHPEATLDLVTTLTKTPITNKQADLIKQIREVDKKIPTAPLAYACELIKTSKTLKAELVLSLVGEYLSPEEFLSMFKNRKMVKENILPTLAQYFT